MNYKNKQKEVAYNGLHALFNTNPAPGRIKFQGGNTHARAHTHTHTHTHTHSHTHTLTHSHREKF
jgi:hypothetical protein